ncbi:arv1-like protein [Elsinoe australis]|uniref:Protein ARV n=1 Tax=Elsinoe australis TaxID=40998 RepID=A0A4U7B5Y7_9PEZI|nr:arv1-like protein [Elsinoe australis]
MPICIECGYKLANLYTTYSKADDRALGKGVRLTQCPRCKRFADKYVEHDYVVIFIDLVLIKPQVQLLNELDAGNPKSQQVYRHLLFNRLGREDDHFDPSIIRLGVLLLLFDVYLTWARIEKATSPSPSSLAQSLTPPLSPAPLNFTSNSTTSGNSSLVSPSAHQSSPHPLPGQSSSPPFSTFLATQPIILQYLFFLTLCFTETAAFHFPIRWLLGLFPPSSPSPQPPQTASPNPSTSLGPTTNPSSSPSPLQSSLPWYQNLGPLIPYYPHPSVISTALLVSSFTKLFPLLLLIWSYDLPSSASAVSWAVIVNNVAALDILLDCGVPRAVLLAAVGAVCRGVVGWGVLRAVGVEGGVAAAGVVETGDLIEGWGRVAAGLGFG